MCGGWNKPKQCFQLDNGTWKEHSTLNEDRYSHSAVTTHTATFIFGGYHSGSTYEYLPKDSTTWQTGKVEIPKGFHLGYAIAVESKQEVWLIGGRSTEERILSFNVNEHTFRELPFKLNERRFGLKCTFIPNTNKIIVTGGSDWYFNRLDSSEIIDTEDGSVSMTPSGMNYCRDQHGIGVVTINGEDRVAVFGGRSNEENCLDSIELYNGKTAMWEKTEIKLNEPKVLFGFLTLKLSDVISNF